MRIIHDKIVKAIKENIVKRDVINQNDLQKLIDEILDAVIPVFQEALKKEGKISIEADRKESEEFVKRNIERWQKGFDALEYHISLCREIGSEYNQHYRQEAASNSDYLFDVITRNHARSCLIASEILCLLKNGFPDGAEARWRALHEVAVTSNFILQHGQDCAERYLFHHFVDELKKMEQLKKYAPKLNLGKSLPTDEILDEYSKIVDDLVKKFGDGYKKPYGWAHAALGISTKARATFAQIEAAAGLEHWRPYYASASHNTHASSHGMIEKIGLVEAKKPMLLVGQSNSGMTEPAHSTAISLVHATLAILTYKKEILDSAILSSIILNSIDIVGNEFYTAHINTTQENPSD